AVFARDILSLFGSQFEAGSACLIILAVGQFANCMTGCSNGMLLWAGHSKLVMWNNVATYILQISLYLLLVPSYGIIGAALVVSVCHLLNTFLRIFQVHHVLGVWPYDSTLVKPVASALISLALVLTVRTVLPAYETGVLAGLFILTYGSLQFMFGLHAGDRALLEHLRRRLTRSAYPASGTSC